MRERKCNTQAGGDDPTGVLISPYPDQEGNKLHSPRFMEDGGSLPHSKVSTTCPYPSQINPFLCPSHFWQTQLVSFLVGLRTYQHLGTSDRRNISFPAIRNHWNQGSQCLEKSLFDMELGWLQKGGDTGTLIAKWAFCLNLQSCSRA